MTTSGSIRGIPFCTLGGGHYAIDPVLESRSGPVPRREGPGQLAILLCEERSAVVHIENFLDRHIILPPDAFKCS